MEDGRKKRGVKARSFQATNGNKHPSSISFLPAYPGEE
jgi:hypothetical protein